MTYLQAIEEAKKIGGAYIQERGCGSYSNWIVCGKSYPGHSRGVYEVSRTGTVSRCI